MPQKPVKNTMFMSMQHENAKNTPKKRKKERKDGSPYFESPNATSIFGKKQQAFQSLFTTQIGARLPPEAQTESVLVVPLSDRPLLIHKPVISKTNDKISLHQ